MSDPSLCTRCGRCCYAKVILDGQVVVSPFPCDYLDETTRLCTIYDRRFETNPQCLPVEMGVRLGVFPPDCPYVRDLPDYVPPRRMTRAELEALAGAVLDAKHPAPRPRRVKSPTARPRDRNPRKA